MHKLWNIWEHLLKFRYVQVWIIELLLKQESRAQLADSSKASENLELLTVVNYYDMFPIYFHTLCNL